MSKIEPVNILMVDDQPAKLLSYEAILGELGEHLISATSGREALEQLLKNDIAIVLMDVSMPEIDGFELAAMIRQHPRYQKTAIIFVSAVRQTDLDRLQAYELGAVDYIPVPVIPEILRAKVSVFAELNRKTRLLEGLNEELERRVEERTAELEAATARERAARLTAEAATKVRDDFLSVAAHELKTPVTGLRAIAQLLLRRMQKREITEYPWLTDGLVTIDQQSERLTRLIGQLLDVSRLDKDDQEAEREETNLSSLVTRLVASFRARTTKHRFVLIADEELIAEVDATGIEQVISNLLDNAIKYSPDGGAIEIEARLSDEHYARLVVRDHGIGIPSEKRDEIFERFFRAHSDDHRSGLGLGLYISRQIVELHGGKIAVEFPPDGGTRFEVLLPVAAKTLAPMQQP
ncbi:MAG TPA: ATP-binding protein [Ktedonobacterales bacterium]